jgi:hypothetical protein
MNHHMTNNLRPAGDTDAVCAFCQDNLEAYALDAMEPVDRARMTRHLEWCGPCRRALAEVRQITELLGLAVEQESPSPDARTRLFERLAEESSEQAEPVVTFGNPWATKSARTEPVPSAAPAPEPSRRAWLGTALVAPLAIALIVVGAWANALRNDVAELESRQENLSVAMNQGAQPNQLRLYSMEPSCPECDDSPATGHLGGDPEENVGILVAWNLDPSQGHQVWCENRDGELLLVSDLDVEQSGEVVQALNFPDAIGGYSTIYVTRHDGTEEMRVALNEGSPGDDPIESSTPIGS